MKRNCLAIVTLILISSLLLTPVQASITTYIWDNIHYVEGTDIDYPHPDRDYYDISISSDWTAIGTKLYHIQFDHDTSAQAGVGIGAACLLIGVAVGVIATPIVGTITGIVLYAIAAGAIIELLDEAGCLWFWVSISFVDWLIDNAWWLGPLCIASPLLAQEEIMVAFLLYGYLRLGSATVYDAVGAGNPHAYTLSISATYGGTTNPASGTYTYYGGESVTVTTTVYEGYTFDYWILDGTTFYSNPITVAMDSDHNLKAYFEYVGGGGGGGGWQLEPCPTLFVWNGNSYVDYGVINIHNPSGEDIVKEVPVLAEDVDINNYKATFRLREGWEGLNQSESVIDQVKLYAVDNYGNHRLCPLISAEHSRLGKVLPQLLLSDDVKAQILLLETIDLTFIVPCQNVQNYTFVIEGCNLYK
jgi:hypothetical protein